MGKRKKGKLMATQIAATPTLRGNDAKKLIHSLKKKPTARSNRNGQALVDFFKAYEKKGR
ncbi:hypothetical protein [Paenibacillus polymyxa]|uniref:hypothetical protein n=1 Tax=Paenibacillus polymyxa TaxID=1406 RepID=UPI0004962260|nr:hypothetical protein [Paenibacillus polymyxa]KAF6630484.1 hypothetical protein H6F38_13700 [Paenibacillus sp. EKM208P]